MLAFGAAIALGTIVASLTAGCDSAPATDRNPEIVALGPIHADVSGRRLDVGLAIWDAESDPVPVALSWCDAAAGQSCSMGTCTPTGVARSVRGQSDRLDMTVANVTWKLACADAPPATDQTFTLCLRTTDPTDGDRMRETQPLTLDAFDASPDGRPGEGPLPPESCP